MLAFDQLSYWEKQTYLENIDYLIVGSGIVGLSAAIHLKQAQPKKKVVVLERGYLPSGASTKNAGFACLGSPSELLADLADAKAKVEAEDRGRILKSDDRNPKSEPSSEVKLSGVEWKNIANNQNVTSSGVEMSKEQKENSVWNTYAKRFQGLQYLREMLGDEAIDYQEKGSYELFKDREQLNNCLNCLDLLNQKVEAITGVKNNFQENHSILESSGLHGFCGAISIKCEGMINTGKMMQSLISKAISLGVLILNGIEVEKVDSKTLRIQDSKKSRSKDNQSVKNAGSRTRINPEVSEALLHGSASDLAATITTSYGTIQAAKVAVCTNGLATNLLQTLAQTQTVKPVRAQVVVTSPIPNLPFRGTFHFDEGYYYFRNVGDRVLFGGGRNLNFEAEETDELNTSDQIINHLSSVLEENILPNHAFTIDYHWAGTMGVGEAKNPIVEQISENVFCGVRLGGMGVAIGSLVGKEMADLMID